ncbi:hypothetical protein FACS189487_10170 [Campylobacterota bacterium]|nr:hypothetical protein FACS189487_10170 [Campylobacterota bacterium]
MSFIAIDPNTGNTQGVDWFHLNRKKIGLCPVCDAEMELRAESSVTTTVHFWHGIGAICPSIKKNRKKYENLPPSSIDEQAGLRLRTEAREHIYTIYQACNAIVDGLKYAEFRDLIAKASEKNIWDYKGFRLNYIPYVLVTFHDMFFAKGSKLRDDKYYIVLEPTIQYLDDLWNKPQSIKQAVWKVSPDKGVIETLSIKPTLDPVPGWFRDAAKKLPI